VPGDTWNAALVAAGCLSALVALLHVGVIIGGAPWYRFFGAGERMAAAAEAGKSYPALVTAFITLVFAAWAAYAFSGAGVLPPLPLRKPVLAFIAAVYLGRGVLIAPLLLRKRFRPPVFVLWSSAASAGIGAAHLVGLLQAWPAL
jgi:hypothetical protein